MNANIARSGWVSVGAVVVMGSGVARGDWPQPPENIREHVVSLKEETPALKAVRENLAVALAGVKPGEEAGVQISATAEKGYLMWGDLFKTGGCFALYEPKEKEAVKLDAAWKPGATLALAEWKDGKWELRGLWKMPLGWVPQEDRWSGNEYKYVERDTLRMPWELEDLIGDTAPEVIISGEKPKYRQARYVMKFDKKSGGLDLLTYSMKKPEKVGKYLKIYDASGNKAIWSEWTFLEWSEGKLEERAVWRSVTPYTQPAPSFTLVEVTPEGGKRKSYRIEQPESFEDKRDVFKISQSGLPIGTVTVEWQSDQIDVNDRYARAGAVIFHQMTGLPREVFPEVRDGKVPDALGEEATVQTDGGATLNAMFFK
jgi:hypothetical protein